MLPTVYRFGVRIAIGKFPSQKQEEKMTLSSNSLYGASLGATYGYGTKNSATSESSFAEALLTSMDSDSSGSIDSAEFSSAALALSISDESAISSAFTAMDSDGDGSVSFDELNSTLAQMSSSAAGSMPPPPPPSSSSEHDTGLSEEEMTSLLKEVSSTDDPLADLLSSVVENFDAADADGDGKVTFAEAMSYQQSSESSTDTTKMSTVSAAGGTPPPPPPPSSSEEEDTGYTEDELSAMANDVSSTDSALSSLFETLASNFDDADANGDGKVSAAEARAYRDSQNSSDTTTNTSEVASTQERTMDRNDEMMKTLLAQIISNYASQNTLSGTSVSFNA